MYQKFTGQEVVSEGEEEKEQAAVCHFPFKKCRVSRPWAQPGAPCSSRVCAPSTQAHDPETRGMRGSVSRPPCTTRAQGTLPPMQMAAGTKGQHSASPPASLCGAGDTGHGAALLSQCPLPAPFGSCLILLRTGAANKTPLRIWGTNVLHWKPLLWRGHKAK